MKCETRGEVCRCRGLLLVEGMEMSFPYALKKIDGQWKIFDYAKDCGPEVWDEEN